MAFIDAETVYLHLGFDSAPDAIPENMVTRAIDEAHEDIMRDLRADWQEGGDATLEQAEVELASAYLLRCLASQCAVMEAEVHSPMLKVLGGKKVTDLQQRAKQEEKIGRARLAPFLEPESEAFEFGLSGDEQE